MEKTGHSGKHDLACVSRAGGDTRQDTNEIGKWSGSLAQSTDLASSTAAVDMRARHGACSSEQDSSELAMADLYSAETVEEIVPAIMHRQITRLQALLVSPGIDSLPAKGGWRHIPRDGTVQPTSTARPEAQPIATAQHTSTAMIVADLGDATPPHAAHQSPPPAISDHVISDHVISNHAGGSTGEEHTARRTTNPPTAMRMRHASTHTQHAIIPYRRPTLVVGAKEQGHVPCAHPQGSERTMVDPQQQQQQAPTASRPSSRTRYRERQG